MRTFWVYLPEPMFGGGYPPVPDIPTSRIYPPLPLGHTLPSRKGPGIPTFPERIWDKGSIPPVPCLEETLHWALPLVGWQTLMKTLLTLPVVKMWWRERLSAGNVELNTMWYDRDSRKFRTTFYIAYNSPRFILKESIFDGSFLKTQQVTQVQWLFYCH